MRRPQIEANAGDLIGTQSARQDRVYPTTWQEGKMWDKLAGRERSPLPPVCSGKLEKSYFLQSRDVPLAFSRGYA
jgi:hypothetical protein